MFILRMIRNLTSGKQPYVRLTKKKIGKIWFYNRKEKNIFYIYSHREIDSVTADQIYSNSDYNLRELNRFSDLQNEYESILLQSKHPLILDLGSNIGLAARYFNSVFPEAKIICIEPSFENNVLAKLNINTENIEIVEAAIGSAKGLGKIQNLGADANAFQIERDNENGMVPIVTVDDLIEKNPLHIPFIIKIDIEGFEKDLFATNTSWVSKFQLLIIEPHDWLFPRSASTKNFLSIISSHSRDFVIRGENIFSIRN